MKKSFLYIVVIYCVGLSSASSQSPFALFAKLNYNFSRMGDLNKFQDDLRLQLVNQGIPASSTDAYPPYYGAQFGVLVPVSTTDERDIFIGGLFDYTSTGGRVVYADYSGEARNDQTASAHSFGAMLDTRIKRFNPIYLDLSFTVRLITSSLRNETYVRIGNNVQSVTLDFSSTSFGFEPGIAPNIPLYGFTVGTSVSYLFAFKSSLESNQYKGGHLIFNNGTEVSIDWSGLKLGIMIGYAL